MVVCWEVVKRHYLPPPIAKESKSPLIKKELSPVHLKHYREKEQPTIHHKTISGPTVKLCLVAFTKKKVSHAPRKKKGI